ncbi:hypothetical protein Ccrd_025427 [Cynara cardunculus var. scolymus]|uniref:Uncharacterized protein n=1 Tax=Cynara cardunculus var. scolymus TaxID=59895 RepID=A0A103X814_CYNCS|nr:hypothetical protein Ccrd_025427 [Cynara cardunculus var. scolymus]
MCRDDLCTSSPGLSTSSKPFLITTVGIQYNLMKAPSSESGSITNLSHHPQTLDVFGSANGTQRQMQGGGRPLQFHPFRLSPLRRLSLSSLCSQPSIGNAKPSTVNSTTGTPS